MAKGIEKSRENKLVVGITGASGVAYGLRLLEALRDLSIETGVTTNLLTRAADVTLKERRPLILLVRESPLHLGHLRSLAQLAEMGAIILPPVPAFYAEPRTISDIIDQQVGRMLDLFGFDWPDTKRWGEDLTKGRRKGRSP